MIIATAGHIDHGKTSLVKALTGIDADRLPEERKRGLTIDLGFAYQAVSDDVVLGFVDVPGHEKFVRNMLAGVGGIDLAMLIIAADDGPMPQTVEHLSILDLLGVERGIVALTKIDRVEPARLEQVRTEISELLTDTRFAGAEVFPVSSVKGDGVAELKAALETAAHRSDGRASTGNFRLAIDRVFTVAGAGLVVTGTVYAGQVTVGDKLTLSPQGIDVRVRAIHAQNRDAPTGHAGERCALNIAGADLTKETVSRGDWIVGDLAHAPTKRFDAQLDILPSEVRPLQHWSPVHLHLGAADITGRVATLEGRSIEPGQFGLVQIVLDHPIGALTGDRFIIRDQSAQRTVGGGAVIDPFAPARGRAKPARIAQIKAQLGPDDAALTNLVECSPAGVDLTKFAQARNLTQKEADHLLGSAALVRVGRPAVGFSQTHWNTLKTSIMDALENWHKNWPDRPGPEEGRLRRLLGQRASSAAFSAAIVELLRDKKIVRDGVQLALPSHRAAFSTEDSQLWNEIKLLLEEGELRPPRFLELAELLEMEPRILERFLQRAVRIGLVARVADNRYYLPSTLLELGKMAAQLSAASANGLFKAGEFNKVAGIGRNLTIQLLEYFDRVGLTRRVENERRLVKQPDEIFSGG